MKEPKHCTRCKVEIDLPDETWWQGVRGPRNRFDSSVGDLCDPCHKEWTKWQRPKGGA